MNIVDVLRALYEILERSKYYYSDKTGCMELDEHQERMQHEIANKIYELGGNVS